MHRLPRLGALALILLLLAALASPLVAGTVTGTVVFDGKAPKLRPVSMDADPACAAKHAGPVASDLLVLGKGGTLGNVFVQIKGASFKAQTAPSAPLVIDQVGCLYEPRVAGVMVGQPVLIKNSDRLMHNVHMLPEKNAEQNIAMPPMLREAKRTFNTPEPLFPVKCDIHPWMRTYLAVMTHPYFAVTSEDGRFEIKGVPPGEYQIEVWHEKLGTSTAAVKVSAKDEARVDFTLTVPKK